MTKTRIFILTVIILITLFILLAGRNPFSFGDAYFRPADNPPASSLQPEFLLLPDNARPTQVNLDRLE